MRSAGCSRRSRSSPPRKRGVISARRSRSICNCFRSRTRNGRIPTVENQVAQLLNLRGVIGQAVERARQEKLIGNALEAAVVLRCEQEAISSIPHEQLEEFFILSDLKIESGKEPAALISKTAHAKCARCWRHRPTVGKSAAHPELCDRCESVVTTQVG